MKEIMSSNYFMYFDLFNTGTIFWRDGDRYEGEFKYGNLNGQGNLLKELISRIYFMYVL